MTVSLTKSEFGKASLTFLGYEIGQGKILPVKAKVIAIAEFKPPEDKKGIMRFLGMAGFYRRFCKNFSSVAAPLTDLLKKNVKFVWSDICQTAFDQIKAMLVTHPILVGPNYNTEFSLSVDASDIGMGAVLTQKDEDRIERPIAYYSKKFHGPHLNYSTIEKEALALITALQHFEVYITSSPFTTQVKTDHNPLTFVHRMKNTNRRLLHWSLELQQYDIAVTHVPGKENLIADALSRS